MHQEILGDDFLRSHVRDADERQHLVRLSGGKQCVGELKRVRGYHVVVGEPVNQQ